MKILVSTITAFIFIQISGCVPFASDELNTRIWMSKESRIKAFKRHLDYQIGRSFDDPRSDTELCEAQKCNIISENLTEYIYENVTETNPPRKCVYAWIVDSSQLLKEDCVYGTGPCDYGLGRRVEWRYVSEPDQCLTSLNFGPS